jgi:hypothetical protein
MHYYIFKPATNTPETGPAYPQVQKMAPSYNYKAPNSVHALSRELEKLPGYEPNLDYLIVHAKAKLSDLLSVAVINGGFLISEKLKISLEQFNLPTHKFYPARVQHKKQFYNYYWMHIICNLTDFVDYPKSTFFVYHNFSKNIGYVDVTSKNELIQKRLKLKSDNPGKTVTIWAEKIKLSALFNKAFDLFEIGTFDANCYISEALQQAITKEKITGCSITPASNLIV